MKKSKIVQILRSAYYGGVENHVYSILKYIDYEKCDVHLICLTNEPVNERFRNLNIHIHQLDDIPTQSFKAIRNIIPLIKVLKVIKPDIVHLHGIRPIFIGSVASRINHVKHIISSYHGSYKLMSIGFDGKQKTHLLLASKLMHYTGFSISDDIIVDADNLKKEIEEIYFVNLFNISKSWIEKTISIHNGIDVSRYVNVYKNHNMRRKIGISSEATVIGTVSRLDEPKKGIAILLKAARDILRRGKDVYFIIVGEGYSKTELQNMAADSSISERVKFLGFWDNLQEIYSTLDIFVLPSISEGFPIVNLEAMASGLPVVATNVGGVPEAIINNVNGILVPPNNKNALRDAILILINNKELREKMGEAGRCNAIKYFNEKDMAKKIFEIYNRQKIN